MSVQQCLCLLVTHRNSFKKLNCTIHGEVVLILDSTAENLEIEAGTQSIEEAGMTMTIEGQILQPEADIVHFTSQKYVKLACNKAFFQSEWMLRWSQRVAEAALVSSSQLTRC